MTTPKEKEVKKEEKASEENFFFDDSEEIILTEQEIQDLETKLENKESYSPFSQNLIQQKS